MAASPTWKVYMGSEYRASFKHVEDAASFVAFLGEGSTIRHGHAVKDIVWTEGKEFQPAAKSYDQVVLVVEERLNERLSKAREKHLAESRRISEGKVS